MQWSPLGGRLAIFGIGALLAVAPLPAQEEEEIEDPKAALALGGEPTTASVSGRLVLENGMPPPDPARVELLCSDQLLGQGYSDSRGNFRIDVDSRDVGGAQTASIDGGERRGSTAFGDVSRLDRYRSCELQISFLGAHSMRTSIAESIAGFGVNVGSITVGQGLDEGLWMSATSYNAPRKARTAFAKGTADLRKGRIESAEKRLREAVALFPKYAAAWHGLGMALLRRGALEEACEAFGHAIAADRDYAPPYSPLLRARADLRDWKQVSVIAERLQELVGGDEPQFFGALALWRMGMTDEATAAVALARPTASGVYRPAILLLAAEIHTAAEHWQHAAQDYREYLALTGDSSARSDIERTLSAWETAGLLAPARVGIE